MKKIFIIILIIIPAIIYGQNANYNSYSIKTDSAKWGLKKDSAKFETSKLFFAFNKPIYVQGHLIGSGGGATNAAIHDSLTANSQQFIKYTGITANSPIFFSQSTGVISAQQASTGQEGVLSSTDWNTLNNKASTHYADSVSAQAAHDTAVVHSGGGVTPQYVNDKVLWTDSTSVYIGSGAGQNTSMAQTVIGMLSGCQNTGDYQTAVGPWAGYQNTGVYQTAIGLGAGYLNTGVYQTAIGAHAGYSNYADSTIFIGFYQGSYNTIGGRISIDPTKTTKPLIDGYAHGDSLIINGDLKVKGVIYGTLAGGLDSSKLITKHDLQDGLSSNVSINTPAFAIDGVSGSNLSMQDNFSTLSVINKRGFEFGINLDTLEGVHIYSADGVIKINDTDTAATRAYARAHGGGGVISETDPIWNATKTNYVLKSDSATYNATKTYVNAQGFLKSTHNDTIQRFGSGNYKIGINNIRPSVVTTGNSDIAIGDGVMYNVTSGTSNIGIGAYTLNNLVTGNYNTGLGYYSLTNTTGSNNIGIGSKAGMHNGSLSHRIYFGSYDYGSLANDTSKRPLFINEDPTAGGNNTLSMSGLAKVNNDSIVTAIKLRNGDYGHLGGGIATIDTTKTVALGHYSTQYDLLKTSLLAGRSGGQTIYGGTAQTELLNLKGNFATASGTNIAGGEVNLYATPGTGTGVSGFHFFTGTTLTTGSTLQTSTEKMTILGNGNVGIGTTTPTNHFTLIENNAVPGHVTFLAQNTNASGSTTFTMQNDGTGQISMQASGSLYANIPALYNKGTIATNYNLTALQFMTNGDMTSGGTAPINFIAGGYNISPTMTITAGNPGNVGIGTTSPTNILSLGGQTARAIWMERNTTANTTGNNLTLQSGGATSAATDKNAGILTLAPGLSTGTGFSSVRLQGLSRAASTGTANNTLEDRIIVPSAKNLTNTSAIGLFDVSLTTLTTSGGKIDYTITSTDGTDIHSITGSVLYDVVNKGGVYTSQITPSINTVATSNIGGTNVPVFTIVTGTNKFTVTVTDTDSLTPTSLQIRYTINNNSSSAITQL